MAGAAGDARTSAYGKELGGLTFNSKPIINNLTRLAAEGQGAHAREVVDLIVRRLDSVRICAFVGVLGSARLGSCRWYPPQTLGRGTEWDANGMG